MHLLLVGMLILSFKGGDCCWAKLRDLLKAIALSWMGYSHISWKRTFPNDFQLAKIHEQNSKESDDVLLWPEGWNILLFFGAAISRGLFSSPWLSFLLLLPLALSPSAVQHFPKSFTYQWETVGQPRAPEWACAVEDSDRPCLHVSLVEGRQSQPLLGAPSGLSQPSFPSVAGSRGLVFLPSINFSHLRACRRSGHIGMNFLEVHGKLAVGWQVAWHRKMSWGQSGPWSFVAERGVNFPGKNAPFKTEMPDFSNISQNEVMNRVPCAIQ